jgi:glycerol-3-phosphate acyltransferase PlsY
MLFVGLVIVTFFLGSIPTGLLLARRFGVDLRAVGSGNIGTANVSRALGKRWGLVVLILDASKGALPVLLAERLFASSFAPAVIGLTAVLGQVFSIFLRGKGGKGVATSLGAGLALSPVCALTSAGVFVVLYLLTRIPSVASLVAVTSYPLFLWVWHTATVPNLIFAFVIAVVVIARHRDNLHRLIDGKENHA